MNMKNLLLMSILVTIVMVIPINILQYQAWGGMHPIDLMFLLIMDLTAFVLIYNLLGWVVTKIIIKNVNPGTIGEIHDRDYVLNCHYRLLQPENGRYFNTVQEFSNIFLDKFIEARTVLYDGGNDYSRANPQFGYIYMVEKLDDPSVIMWYVGCMKPGKLIGLRGELIGKVEDLLTKRFGKPCKIYIFEIPSCSVDIRERYLNDNY